MVYSGTAPGNLVADLCLNTTTTTTFPADHLLLVKTGYTWSNGEPEYEQVISDPDLKHKFQFEQKSKSCHLFWQDIVKTKQV